MVNAATPVSGRTAGLIGERIAAGYELPVNESEPEWASSRMTPECPPPPRLKPPRAYNVPVTLTELATSLIAPPDPAPYAELALLPAAYPAASTVPETAIDPEDAIAIAPPPAPPGPLADP